MSVNQLLLANGRHSPLRAGGRCLWGAFFALLSAGCTLSNHAWRPFVPIASPNQPSGHEPREKSPRDPVATVQVEARDGQLHALAIRPSEFGSSVHGINGSLQVEPLACGYDSETRMFSNGAARIAAEPNACTHDNLGNPALAGEKLPNASVYSLAVIEFDDFGEFWNPHQLTWAKARLKAVGKGDRESRLDDPRVVLLGYVHGWRHNASEHSHDFREFRDMIRKLASSPKACELFDVDDNMSESEFYTKVLSDITPSARKVVTTSTVPCHIFGFYVGWRGDSTGLTQLRPTPDNRRTGRKGNPLWRATRAVAWFAQSFSPLGRKASARRVASVPATRALLELGATFAELESARRQAFLKSRFGGGRLDDLCPGARDATSLGGMLNIWARNCASRSIVVGHSFGARVLENTVAQGLIGRQDLARRMNVDDRTDVVGRLLEARRKRAIARQGDADRLGGLLELLAEAKKVLDNQLAAANADVEAAEKDLQAISNERATASKNWLERRRDLVKAAEQSVTRSKFHEIHHIACLHLQRSKPLERDKDQPPLAGLTYR